MPLIPETSPYYTYEVITTAAPLPRYPGSIVLPVPSRNDEDYKLKLCYRRYQSVKKDIQQPINLIFLHGVGMNKALWHTYIDSLYQTYPRLNVCLALDAVNHADSAEANRNRLGYIYNWQDGAKDFCKIAAEDEGETFLKQNALNIVVAHSMSGFKSIAACLREPNLFDAITVVNPVSYTDDVHRKVFPLLLKHWIDAEKIQDEFTAENGVPWLQQVTNFFTKVSFYKKFDPTILTNMIFDEYNGNYNPEQKYDKVTLKSSKIQQLVSYASSAKSIQPVMPVFNQVRTPVYFVHSEHDMADKSAVEFLLDSLKEVVTYIQVPGTYHSVNGEAPDVFLPILKSIIDERITKQSNKSIDDFGFQKKFGNDYKRIVLEKYFTEFTGDDMKGKL